MVGSTGRSGRVSKWLITCFVSICSGYFFKRVLLGLYCRQWLRALQRETARDPWRGTRADYVYIDVSIVGCTRRWMYIRWKEETIISSEIGIEFPVQPDRVYSPEQSPMSSKK